MTFYSKLVFKAATGDCAINVAGAGKYMVGSEYTVTLNINTGGNNIVAAEVVLNYPANLLQLQSDQKGSNWAVYGDPGSSAGSLDRLIGAPSGVNGTTVLMTAKFKAIASGSGQFSFQKAVSADQNTQSVNTTASGASFSVAVGGSSTSTPTSTSTPQNNNSPSLPTPTNQPNENGNITVTPAPTESTAEPVTFQETPGPNTSGNSTPVPTFSASNSPSVNNKSALPEPAGRQTAATKNKLITFASIGIGVVLIMIIVIMIRSLRKRP